jgi:hypothetical protein
VPVTAADRAGVPVRLYGALVRPTVRAVSWAPVLGGSAAGIALMMISVLLEDDLAVSDLATLLRLAAVCTAVGAAFLLDDPATRTIRAVPVPLMVRTVVRVVVALPVLGGGWAVAAVLAGAQRDSLPLAGLALEAAAVSAVALAVAAARLHAGDGSDAPAGPLAAGVVLVAAVAATFVDRPVVWFAAPGAPQWAASHRGWAVVLVVAVAVVVAATGRHRFGRRGGSGSKPLVRAT